MFCATVLKYDKIKAGQISDEALFAVIDTKEGYFYTHATILGLIKLLITDWKKNLSDLFEIDKEIVTYKTPEECIENVRYYSLHEDERKQIAAAGQRRTLTEHTFKSRVNEMVKVMESWDS